MKEIIQMSLKRSLALTVVGVCFLATALFFVTTGSANTATRRSTAKAVTFNKDVAPIFFQKCADCHHAGEAAPFSVLRLQGASPWAKSIKGKSRQPSKCPLARRPHFGQFANDRRPDSAADRYHHGMGRRRRSRGKCQGPSAAPSSPMAGASASLMSSLEAEEYTVEASGPDEYQYFEVATNFTEDKYIQMAEARPGNRQGRPHIIAFIVPARRPNTTKMTKAQR
jgi:hypothetical protein